MHFNCQRSLRDYLVNKPLMSFRLSTLNVRKDVQRQSVIHQAVLERQASLKNKTYRHEIPEYKTTKRNILYRLRVITLANR